MRTVGSKMKEPTKDHLWHLIEALAEDAHKKTTEIDSLHFEVSRLKDSIWALRDACVKEVKDLRVDKLKQDMETTKDLLRTVVNVVNSLVIAVRWVLHVIPMLKHKWHQDPFDIPQFKNLKAPYDITYPVQWKTDFLASKLIQAIYPLSGSSICSDLDKKGDMRDRT